MKREPVMARGRMGSSGGNLNLQTPFLRIGTRGSRLALVQAEETRARLAAAHGVDPQDIAITVISTTGDRVRDRPLSEIGGKGLFTKEIEEALLAGTIDIAVHSMKDMPSLLPEGLAIGALLPREDARDAFLSPVCGSIAALPQGARIGSSSVRRTAQLLARRPDVAVLPFRGNVETRLRKLDQGEVDATFLAVAGLNRLGLAGRITAAMEVEDMLPAVAQGAIGIELRLDDRRVEPLVAALNHAETAIAITCERAFLATLDGSCRTPIAGYAVLAGRGLEFRGEALTTDGRQVFKVARIGVSSDAAAMGREAGLEIQRAGGSVLTL